MAEIIELDKEKEKEEHKIVGECRACGKKFRSGMQGKDWIVRQPALFVGPQQLSPALLEFICLSCGNIFLTPESVEQAKSNYIQGQQKIIIPRLIKDSKLSN